MASRVERDPAADYRRLHAAYQQSLRYAEDVRRLYHQLQRATGQSLPGLSIPLEARIVAVADVFDALTSARSYRAALPRDAVRACLATEAGHTLDETVVAALLGVLDREER